MFVDPSRWLRSCSPRRWCKTLANLFLQRFDRGPSLLLLPEMFRETFADLGTSLEAEGVKLVKCEPNYQLWFHDGETMQLSTDTAQMKREVERWEGKEGFERYLGFLQESHRHYEDSVTHVLRQTFPSIWSIFRPATFRKLLFMHAFEPIWSRASIYFHTERLRRAFTFGSMYMGMSPFEAPGTYSLLQYTELAEGIWYPIGGFHAVIDAIVKIAERHGATFRLSTPVSRINIDPASNAATGVTLASGETLKADLTIVNADLVYATKHLLPPSRATSSLTQRATSCSSISFYWALHSQIPVLHAHNIFLAAAYQASFDDIFKRHLLPADPSFYVNVPSRIDPSAAPAGTDAVVVLVPCGHLVDGEARNWAALVDETRAAIVATVKARAGVDFAPLIAHERVNTPETWERDLNLDRGAILGLSHSFFNVLCWRPQMRSREHGRLYFVGASTHPGTGVPIVLAGAKLLSRMILGHQEDARSETVKGKGPLDVLHDPVMLWQQSLWVIALMAIAMVGYLWLVNPGNVVAE